MPNKVKIKKILGYVLFSLLLLYSFSLWGVFIGSLFFLVTLISFLIYLGISVKIFKNRKLKYFIISIIALIITLFLTVIYYPPREIRLASRAYLHIDTLKILSDTSAYINRARIGIYPERGTFRYREGFSFHKIDKDGDIRISGDTSKEIISYYGLIDSKDKIIQLKQEFNKNDTSKHVIYLQPTKDGLLDIKSNRLFSPYKNYRIIENDTSRYILKKKFYHSIFRIGR